MNGGAKSSLFRCLKPFQIIVRYRIVVAAIHSMNRRICELSKREFDALIWRVISVVVVVLKFYVATTSTVIGRRD